MRVILYLLLLSLLFTFCLAAREGDACKVDSDCHTFNNCISKKCVRKLIFPIDVREVFATFWILIISAFTTAGGVAVGSTYVPYLQLFMGYSQVNAISAAYLIAFGGNVGNFLTICRIRNKNTGGPMIYYNLSLIIVPTLILGSQFGVLTRRILPNLVSSLFLLVILAFGSYKYGIKFFSQYRIEKEAAQQKKKALANAQQAKVITENKPVLHPPTEPSDEPAESKPVEPQKSSDDGHSEKRPSEFNPDESSGKKPRRLSKGFKIELKELREPTIFDVDEFVCGVIPEYSENTPVKAIPEGNSPPAINSEHSFPDKLMVKPQTPEVIAHEVVESAKYDAEYEKQRARIIARETSLCPLVKLKEILLLLVIILVTSILRGGKKIDSPIHVTYCSTMDWTIFAIQLSLFFLCILRNIWLVHGWQKEQEKYNIPYSKEYPKIDGKTLSVVLIVSLIAGYSGAIGAIGGGFIIVPFLFGLGYSPLIAAYISGSFCMFPVLNSAIQVYFGAQIVWQQIVWFIPLSMIFSYFSAKLTALIYKKTGNQAFNPFGVWIIATSSFFIILGLLINDSVIDWTAVSKQPTMC